MPPERLDLLELIHAIAEDADFEAQADATHNGQIVAALRPAAAWL